MEEIKNIFTKISEELVKGYEGKEPVLKILTQRIIGNYKKYIYKYQDLFYNYLFVFAFSKYFEEKKYKECFIILKFLFTEEFGYNTWILNKMVGDSLEKHDISSDEFKFYMEGFFDLKAKNFLEFIKDFMKAKEAEFLEKIIIIEKIDEGNCYTVFNTKKKKGVLYSREDFIRANI
ncbi:MAG: hypothetical protein XD76_0602 [candidate division TA06 bacterium 32_111]|uniref:Uncharacterized protein n=2 Tax=Bacteria candidate phyla TaxID=1783234 RepID=A0A101I361_UNCT6|nr:MAG: hypothetical protein XD76_0602 [candidate division TA06 bacterium 32_111]KUK87788.1 MAG: hypothetical protein XE03_0307 [candidate division TA06 bacterium 34_109]HAF07942.1 hypothetical protein [candidate division WOR-3 bacterium]HCP16356.1 hypothetical protein [candidate division WOR-3 bacterium]